MSSECVTYRSALNGEGRNRVQCNERDNACGGRRIRASTPLQHLARPTEHTVARDEPSIELASSFALCRDGGIGRLERVDGLQRAFKFALFDTRNLGIDDRSQLRDGRRIKEAP